MLFHTAATAVINWIPSCAVNGFRKSSILVLNVCRGRKKTQYAKHCKVKANSQSVKYLSFSKDVKKYNMIRKYSPYVFDSQAGFNKLVVSFLEKGGRYFRKQMLK